MKVKGKDPPERPLLSLSSNILPVACVRNASVCAITTEEGGGEN
jgi:hypothetical protein